MCWLPVYIRGSQILSGLPKDTEYKKYVCEREYISTQVLILKSNKSVNCAGEVVQGHTTQTAQHIGQVNYLVTAI